MPRLFIAINLPACLKAELKQQQDKIKALFPPEASGVFKWVAPQNLHLTLSFLGEVKENKVPALLDGIQNKIGDKKSFPLVLKEIVFDKKPIPRLLWAVIEENRQVNGLFAEKSFKGHITLARIREWQFRKIDPEEIPEINIPFKKTFQVKSIELMQSKLGPKGSSYSILHSFLLN